MELFSPGKINLTLDVGRKREDGYHEVETVMQTFDFGDVLCFHERRFGFELNCTQAPSEELFLIRRAYDFFCEELGSCPGVRIRLEKHLPMCSGLGGGSSNAAKVLLGLNKLYKAEFPKETLIRLASQIGSDVPFFLNGKRAVARGRGTQVQEISHSSLGYILLVNDNTKLHSQDVYEKIDEMEQEEPKTAKFIDALEKGQSVVPYISNHLEKAAFELAPNLKEIKEKLLTQGALTAHLCGSGGSLFGLFKTREEAAKAKLVFREEFVYILSI